MATRRGNPDQYLQKVGNTYYARVRVPRTLEKYTGQSHLRRSLVTGSRAEANLKKHAVVASLKAELEALRKAPPSVDAPGISFADARAIRDQVTALKASGDTAMLSTVEIVTIERAESLERLLGHEQARKWYRAATKDDDTLAALMTKWMEVSDYKESTKAGHRKALDDVLVFLDDPEAVPADVTRGVAINFIDTALTQRNLAYATVRDRLVSLGGFWGWMASRNAVPANLNPWTGHKVSKKQNAGTRPAKRAYTDDELIKLLEGNETVKGWPTYAYLPDLMVLGLFTGAREEELCSLKVADIDMGNGQCVFKVMDAKTKAGLRFVAVTHPAPLAVLKRRMKGGKERLFPELKPGGLDDKFSSSAVKAFGRYRRACGVPDGTDFHSFRRNVITVLERAKVDQVAIARFVGHKVGTLAGDTYSQGGNAEGSLQASRKLTVTSKVELAVAALQKRLPR